MIRMPLINFPWIISEGIAAKVSLERLWNFFMSEELESCKSPVNSTKFKAMRELYKAANIDKDKQSVRAPSADKPFMNGAFVVICSSRDIIKIF
jgi:hypothetical protein